MSASDIISTSKVRIDEFLQSNPTANDIVSKIQEHTGVERTTAAVTLVLLPVALLIAFFNFNVIIDIVGFVYPFIASISALQTEDKADDEQWLTYWIVFALFKMFESILDTFISFIPFYHWLKLSFLTFCWYPRGNDADPGATLIYKKIIAVYIAPHVTSLMDSTVKKKE